VTDVTSQDAPDEVDLPQVEVSDQDLRHRIEAVLLVADEPLEEKRLAQVLRAPEARVRATLVEISEQLSERDSGVELRRSGAGWRYYTAADCAPIVEQFLLEGQSSRLSQAALETLTIVDYRQPVSRGRVSGIRGVNVDAVMRTLLTRGLVTEVGTDPETAAVLYGTTPLFLEKLGLQTLEELPSLAPLMPEINEFESA
jgi:segregation and condensation protein B